jgi:hypothetical protein
MSDIAGNRFRKPQLRQPPGAHGLSRLPLVAIAVAACIGVAVVVYLLWPRWPGADVATDAPSLPITVAGVAFNVPPAAIRIPVQRRPGAQERVDLAFLWPSLEPPDPHAKVAPGTANSETLPAATLDRLFVTLAAATDRLAPADRARAIYTRYVGHEAIPDQRGLLTLPFRDGSPYQGEDLIYETPANDGFLVRWLDDWKTVARQIDRLIARMRPRT